jgi:nucleotide-binding universal stress UspA family protein
MTELPAPAPTEQQHIHWASTVVVHVRAGRPSSTALDAAIGLARALEADVVGQYVEDQTLLSVAGLSCVREVSFGGRRAPTLSFARLETDMMEASTALKRDLLRRAAQAGVPVDCAVVRDDPDTALASLCVARTVVALTEPFDATQGRLLPRLFAECAVSGALVCGAHASQTQGPLVVLVTATAGLNGLLEAAASLLEAGERDLVILTLGHDAAETAAFTTAARIATGYDSSVRIDPVEARRGPGMIADTARRLGAGLLMARWSPEVAAFVPALVPALDCPLLLLR